MVVSQLFNRPRYEACGGTTHPSTDLCGDAEKLIEALRMNPTNTTAPLVWIATHHHLLKKKPEGLDGMLSLLVLKNPSEAPPHSKRLRFNISITYQDMERTGIGSRCLS